MYKKKARTITQTRIKKITQTRMGMIMLSVIFLLSNTQSVFAANIGYVQEKLRVLFVIDASGSMTSNDSDGLINEFVKMYIDTVDESKTEVGVLTFSDSIKSTYPIVAIENPDVKNEIKANLNNIVRKGSTDIGLALNTGVEMFLKEKKDTKNVIVFFSDGETDLNQSSIRTYADSQNDEFKAYEKANQNNISIFTIGVSKNGTLDTSYLFKIAEKTKGKTYEIRNTKDIHSIFNNLFNATTGVPLKLETIAKNTNQSLTQSITIPTDKIKKANVLLQYDKALSTIGTNPKASELVASKIYSLVKIDAQANTTEKATTTEKSTTTATDKIDITYNMGSNNDIKFNQVNYLNVEPKIEILGNAEDKAVEVTVRYYDIKKGEVVTDTTFYKGLNAELTLYNTTTNELSKLPMTNTNSSFVTTYNNDVPSLSNVRITISGVDYKFSSPAQTLEFKNTAPAQSNNEQIITLKGKKQKKIDLDTYFIDPNKDFLTYEVVGNNKNLTNLNINQNELIINPNVSGDDIVRIKATDQRGQNAEGILLIIVQPFLIYYRVPIITISLITIALLAAIALLEYRKRRVIEKERRIVKTSDKFYNVRFEGYFLNTASGNEIPTLYFNPSYIDGKPVVSLGDLLSLMDVKEKLPESKKIYFKAAQNDSVMFYHYTNCDVTLGNRIVSRGNEAVLQYDDRLYIIFEDGATEIEIRCKRLVKSRV